MAHYSEMDFLFSKDNKDSIIKQTQNEDNTRNIFNDARNNNYYVVYKGGQSIQKTDAEGFAYFDDGNINTQGIKNYLKESVYNDTTNYKNPYIKLIETFKTTNGTPGAGLRVKASDLAYLRELGVYPINRMAILRRFPEGAFVPENLDEMRLEPISTVIGWIPTNQNFGNISFNESWGLTNKRFDVLLSEIINKNTGGKMDSTLLAPPEFAQGLLFEFYNRAGLTDSNPEGSDWREQNYELYNESIKEDKKKGWGYNNIPVGDPNVLMEGPFRDAAQQNIQSKFTFNIETTYEQKLLGEVDPGSAMLDIIDNLYAMGTSNMKYYWSENSKTIKAAKSAVNNSTDVFAWWVFIKAFFGQFWEGIVSIFNDVTSKIGSIFKDTMASNSGNTTLKLKDVMKDPIGEADKFFAGDSWAKKFLDSIMTSTISIYRFEIRGSIELMTGAKDSSTPWYLTIGNPFSPWLSTNHIVVKSAEIESSTEMGYQDMPTWIKVKFSCEFSRSLGRQELMRMLNNTYTRTYTNSSKVGASQDSIEKQKEVINPGSVLPGTDSNFSGFDKNALKTSPMAAIPPGRSGYYQYSPPNTDSGGINPNTA